ADQPQLLTIAGVVKDFAYLGLQRRPENLMITYQPDRLRYASLLISGHDVPGTIRFLEKSWQSMEKVHPFNYAFFDQQVNRVANTYLELVELLGFLAIIAITITCLGLLGIATYSVETRTKEIGIRKVLGASIQTIIWTLSKSLFWPLLLAIVLGTPLVWWISLQWLSDLAYDHIDLQIWNVGLGTVIMFGLGILIICSQAYRIALRNPADSLRAE
ncbi:MAG: FtsX-like permease family protein, partial [Bacteroidota bacterium]